MAGKSSLLSKMRGALVGSLAGDCLGNPFQTKGEFVSKSVLDHYLIGLQDPNLKVPYKPYTDDTAMTKNVVRSLLECKGYNPKDMAVRFVEEYKKDPKRDYGERVVNVFARLNMEGYEDPYRPAREQFDKQGSFGNGAAMRVAPVALYFCHNLEKCLEVAEEQARLTHFNWIAIMGAVLQSSAVFHALNCKEGAKLEAVEFVNKLRESIERIVDREEKTECLIKTTESYQDKLNKVLVFLKKSDPTPEHVADELGNGFSALESVHTAIYSFLKAVKETGDAKSFGYCWSQSLPTYSSLNCFTTITPSTTYSLVGYSFCDGGRWCGLGFEFRG
ncbi:hypothetical protein QYM36_017586 [Artemia franciscana]|uniref:ADP-ribosylhydrolase ARH3 n=1 Tax=Artemia franciscana TaxID=6661 RepID=A0AA88KVP9_ARTSF|nr:hypothetical protein QYM36_017586 [Artemia franciscana]